MSTPSYQNPSPPGPVPGTTAILSAVSTVGSGYTAGAWPSFPYPFQIVQDESVLNFSEKPFSFIRTNVNANDIQTPGKLMIDHWPKGQTIIVQNESGASLDIFEGTPVGPGNSTRVGGTPGGSPFPNVFLVTNSKLGDGPVKKEMTNPAS
jgi:hypothetical protein